VVAPLFKLNQHRNKSLELLEKHMKNEHDVGFIPIEQDIDVWPEFNKGWLLNIAVNKSDAEWIVVNDVDVVPMKTTYYVDTAKWLDDRELDWGFGWNKLLYKSEDGCGNDRDDWPSPGIQEGGIVYFRRKLWDDIGGANEYIRELRAPDNDIAFRAMYVSGTRSAKPETLTHRWHPISSMKNTKWRRNNRSILEYTYKRPDKVISMLKKENRGNKNGPYCMNRSFYEARIGK
jgi:hypothetical protein